jgi:hypothetical protein
MLSSYILVGEFILQTLFIMEIVSDKHKYYCQQNNLIMLKESKILGIIILFSIDFKALIRASLQVILPVISFY